MAFRERPIDISSYAAGGYDYARRLAATALDDELRSSGFAQITGHGIPGSVVAGLADAMTSLFTLDLETKLSWHFTGERNRGYVPSRSETQIASLGIPSVTGLADWVESFDVGLSPADYPHAHVDGVVYAESVWPDIPDFQRRVDAYFNEAGRVAGLLMGALGDAIGLGRAYFDRLSGHSVDTLGMNWYANALAASPDDRGMSEHTDYGLLTVAWADDVPGLEVLDPSGAWQPVRPVPGALIVLVGDLLAQMVDDRWPATIHRAMPAPGVAVRRSAYFFHEGNADALIDTIPALRREGGVHDRRPVTVDEHIRARLAAGRFGAPYTLSRHEADRIRASLG